MYQHESVTPEPRTARRARIRSRLRRHRAVGFTVSLLVGVGVVAASIGSASAEPSAGDWARLRNCESGGNYAINTGNGYYGAYQFDLGTWRSVGGSGLPSDASPATQDALAYKLWQQRGWSPWACASIVGLPEGGSGGPAPKAVPAPVPERITGHFDTVRVSADRSHLTVTGWAVDRAHQDRTTSIRVRIGNAVSEVGAGVARSDVETRMRINGAHGFTVPMVAPAGLQKVCITALGRSASRNVSLGCRYIGVPAVIFGGQTAHRATGSIAVVSGWTFDNAASSRSSTVQVLVNGRTVTRVAANRPASDVNRAFAISGNHAFWAAVPLHSGRNSVCAYASNVKTTAKRSLGCTTVSVAVPLSGVKVVGAARKVTVSGWGFDPNSSRASVTMRVVVNGVPHSVPANQRRIDVNAAFSIAGNHGFSAVLGARKGVNRVCVTTMGTAGIAPGAAVCRNVSA